MVRLMQTLQTPEKTISASEMSRHQRRPNLREASSRGRADLPDSARHRLLGAGERTQCTRSAQEIPHSDIPRYKGIYDKTSLPYFGVKLSCVCLMFDYSGLKVNYS